MARADESARGVWLDAVGGYAGGGIVEDPLGVAPADVLLIGVLALDAQRVAEERQGTLEDDRPLAFESAHLTVSPMVDAGHVGGPPAASARSTSSKTICRQT